MRDIILNKINDSNLSEINLHDLGITDDELNEILVEVKQTRPEVEMLFLSNNKISDKGAALLGAKLTDLNKLTFIDLQFNFIDLEGAAAIFTLKSTRPTLRIALHGNKITDVNDMLKIEQKYK